MTETQTPTLSPEDAKHVKGLQAPSRHERLAAHLLSDAHGAQPTDLDDHAALVKLHAELHTPAAPAEKPAKGRKAPKSNPEANGDAPAAPAKPSARDAKRDLATRVILAAAAMIDSLDGSELAMGVDVNDAAAVTAARDEARRTVSLWLHHLPADRDRWVTVLPKPDRSDWR